MRSGSHAILMRCWCDLDAICVRPFTTLLLNSRAGVLIGVIPHTSTTVAAGHSVYLAEDLLATYTFCRLKVYILGELGAIASSVSPAPPALTSVGNEGTLSLPWEVMRTRLTTLEYFFSASSTRSALVLLGDIATGHPPGGRHPLGVEPLLAPRSARWRKGAGEASSICWLEMPHGLIGSR